MITIANAQLWVLDQDEALAFYTDVLGFEKGDDVQLGPDFRWLTVQHPQHPELQLHLTTPGPPLSDELVDAMRRAQAGEGRHQQHAPAVRHAGGQRLDVARSRDDAEAVAQPLHGGAAHEDAAFQQIVGAAVHAPADRRQQAVARGTGPGYGFDPEPVTR